MLFRSLGAGSIIHAIHSNSMKDMGGLQKYMPITHITFLVACLAISGIPPFAGFFSKDEILAAAFQSNKLLFYTEYITAGLTSFYIFRIYFGIFWGKDRKYEHTPHESPFSMTFPLIFLALGAALVGFIPFNDFVSSDGKPFELASDLSIAIPSVLIGLLGITFAWVLYKKDKTAPNKITEKLGFLYTATYHKFYIDEIYLFVTHKIIYNLIAKPIKWFDRHIVDGFMVGIGNVTIKTSYLIKGFQSGQTQQYAFVFVAGALVFVLTLLYYFGV